MTKEAPSINNQATGPIVLFKEVRYRNVASGVLVRIHVKCPLCISVHDFSRAEFKGEIKYWRKLFPNLVLREKRRGEL